MSEPMTAARAAEIREMFADYQQRHSHPGAFACCSAHPLADLIPDMLAELELAFTPGMYFDIQQVLDKALGTRESDGAGAGIVGDVMLLARLRAAAVDEALKVAVANDKLHADLREADKVIADYDDARQVAVKERDLFRDAAIAQTAALQRYVETLEGHALDAGQSMDERDAGRSVAYAEASAGLSRLLNGLRP